MVLKIKVEGEPLLTLRNIHSFTVLGVETLRVVYFKLEYNESFNLSKSATLKTVKNVISVVAEPQSPIGCKKPKSL